ncbi:S-phase kinase-associated protein 1-like [Drosophila teissieri]|uniref:S-phase kinase-associated protein 1-like n=1 Tax=Drosophila teissieri TaxID=7243 RepID=UPI001CBA2D21|nr:S-phase kinase-associated protein 1-like [Drosophila teissieri]
MKFLVTPKHEHLSLIRTMLKDCCTDDDENGIVPLPYVCSTVLRKILTWAHYHKDDPQPTKDDKSKGQRTDDIISWDADFMKVDRTTLFELILAANYLVIKGLQELPCKTVAKMIKGKIPKDKEIGKTFNIKRRSKARSCTAP